MLEVQYSQARACLSSSSKNCLACGFLFFFFFWVGTEWGYTQLWVLCSSSRKERFKLMNNVTFYIRSNPCANSHIWVSSVSLNFLWKWNKLHSLWCRNTCCQLGWIAQTEKQANGGPILHLAGLHVSICRTPSQYLLSWECKSFMD